MTADPDLWRGLMLYFPFWESSGKPRALGEFRQIPDVHGALWEDPPSAYARHKIRQWHTNNASANRMEWSSIPARLFDGPELTIFLAHGPSSGDPADFPDGSAVVLEKWTGSAFRGWSTKGEGLGTYGWSVEMPRSGGTTLTLGNAFDWFDGDIAACFRRIGNDWEIFAYSRKKGFTHAGPTTFTPTAAIDGDDLHVNSNDSAGISQCSYRALGVWRRALPVRTIHELLCRDPWRPVRPKARVVAPAPAGGSTHTAAGGLTTSGASISGSASFAPGTKSATGDLQTSGASLSGAGTFAPGTKSATGDLTTAGHALAGSGTFASGAKTATGAMETAGAILAGTATFAPGTKSASGDLATAGQAIAGTATFAPGTKSATADLVSAGQSIAGTGTFTTGTKSATADLQTAGQTLAGTGTFAPGTKSAVGALQLAPVTITGAGTFQAPAYQGTADLVTAGTTITAAGSQAEPVGEIHPTTHAAILWHPMTHAARLSHPSTHAAILSDEGHRAILPPTA